MQSLVAHDVALSVRNLTVALPKGMERRHAVENISFDLKREQILCIIGESGSGKSVTANAIMGLLPKEIHVSSGAIELDGMNILGMPPEELRSLRGRVVSMIFQDPLSALNPLMTVGEQIDEVMAAHGIGTPESRRGRAIELLTEVALPDPALMYHQYPFRLSGGQRQRVMIAMALSLEPTILIADEPTTALDVTTQAQILDLIRDIQRRKGMSVMFITHDFGVVAEIADSVVVMEKGHLVEHGSVQQVLNSPSHPYTKRLIAAVPQLTGKDRTPLDVPDSTPVLKVAGLNKTYHTGGGLFQARRVVPAVNDVSFGLGAGRTLGVVGESGSGKSSLGRLLIKLMDGDSGEILFEGRDIAKLSEAEFRPLRSRVQMIFQDPFASLNPRSTIGHILTVGPVAHGMPYAEAREEAMKLLAHVGLDAGAFDRYPHEFSGGQRQRVGIARALMLKPKLLIADEAVSALDVSIQAQILQLLDQIQRETGVSMIFITHDLRVASQICDEIVVMQKGRVVESGPPSQIFINPQSAYTRELVAAIPGTQLELHNRSQLADREPLSVASPQQGLMSTTGRQDSRPTFSRRNVVLGLMAIGGAGGLLSYSMLGKRGSAVAPSVNLSGGASAGQTGRVVVGLSQEPTVFNPLMAHIEPDDGVIFSLFDALFRIDPKGIIQPNLAVEVPTQANGGISEDGLSWRIRLRDDVRWHDGEPFTAEDVKFTLELITNPNFRAWRTAGHSLVRDITVVSPTEITWRMEKAFAPYLSLLTETFMVPKHLLENEANPNAAAFNQNPVGTGAFKWGRRVPGDHLELVANPEYFGEGPFIKRLVFKYIPDLTVLYTQFKSGYIDLVGQTYITQDNYEEARKLPGKVVEPVLASSVEAIHLNHERPQFKDPAVRQALYAAIDRKAIIEALYHGVPSVTETFMPQQSFYYNPDLPKQEYNVERARAILDKAGWVPGDDGIRVKDGVRLSFANSTTSGNHLREQMQQYLQQTFREIGAEMTIENLPPAVMWGDFWMQSKFDTAIAGSTYLIGADPDVTNRFHSRAIPAKGGSGSNNAQYVNAEVDALLEQGTRIFDPEERRAIYYRVQEIIRRDLPILPLFQNTNVFGRSADIKGFEPNSNTRTESWHAASWYVGEKPTGSHTGDSPSEAAEMANQSGRMEG